MTNTNKLKAAIVENGQTIAKIAEKMGVSRFTLHKKLHNQTEFKASEIEALRNILKIKSIDEVFFS